MSTPESLLEELQWRGLLYQQTEGLAAHLAEDRRIYCGFDPTAPSLHIGNMVPAMLLVHLALAGHRVIALVGGGTAMIGDPSGKSAERPLASEDEIGANAKLIREQLDGLFNAAGAGTDIGVRDNAEWLLGLRAVDFMRDVGKHFSVNYMLAKDSVQSRLEGGISYTEFSYMLLQAYDFLQLHRNDGVTVQVGGSDQWGNITAGTELVRRAAGAEAHGLTAPLVTTSSGKKFGKTEAGAVWLDAQLTSPYRFFQFWVNTEDADVQRYLRTFTLLDREKIAAIIEQHESNPSDRFAQRVLAESVTRMIHGESAAHAAQQVSLVIFDKRIDPHSIETEWFKMLATEIPFVQILPGGELAVLDVLEHAFKLSRSAGRKLLQQGSVMVNGEKLSPDALTVPREKAVHGDWFLVRKGGRDIALAGTLATPPRK